MNTLESGSLRSPNTKQHVLNSAYVVIGSACLRAFFSNSTNLLVPALLWRLESSYWLQIWPHKMYHLIAQGMRYMVVLITQFFIFVPSAPFSYVQLQMLSIIWHEFNVYETVQ